MGMDICSILTASASLIVWTALDEDFNIRMLPAERMARRCRVFSDSAKSVPLADSTQSAEHYRPPYRIWDLCHDSKYTGCRLFGKDSAPIKLCVIFAPTETTSCGVLDQHSQWLTHQIIRNEARQGLEPKPGGHTSTCQAGYE